MVHVKSLTFTEPKRLPTLAQLRETYGISFNTVFQHFDSLQFEVEINGFTHILSGGTYYLKEFIADYFEMELGRFRTKFYQKLRRRLSIEGYIQSIHGGGEQLPIRNLAYFANKQRKYGSELEIARGKGSWIKTIRYNVSITTSETDVIIDFIDNVIAGEKLRPQDIVMLKFLKRVGGQVYTIYKIFKSIDVRQIQRLLFNIKIYADGFFGRNMDYSEVIDPLELDIIEAFEGGCSKTQIKINSPTNAFNHMCHYFEKESPSRIVTLFEHAFR